MAEREYEELPGAGNVQDALARLPEGLQLGCGGLRIYVRFSGDAVESSKVAYFRVPANLAHKVVQRANTVIDPDRLADLAHALRGEGPGFGTSELMLEYVDSTEGLRLHWVDFSFEAYPPSGSPLR